MCKPIRNIKLINEYNFIMYLGWEANIKSRAINNKEAIMNYIAKYCWNAEIKSSSLQMKAMWVMSDMGLVLVHILLYGNFLTN